MTAGRLLAVSDLHVSYPRNRQWVNDLPPGEPGDWLLAVGEVFTPGGWYMRLSSRAGCYRKSPAGKIAEYGWRLLVTFAA